ncbi:hypothetical protein D3C77_504070 [compost metagenome]
MPGSKKLSKPIVGNVTNKYVINTICMPVSTKIQKVAPITATASGPATLFKAMIASPIYFPKYPPRGANTTNEIGSMTNRVPKGIANTFKVSGVYFLNHFST